MESISAPAQPVIVYNLPPVSFWLTRYKDNLHLEGNDVWSYTTKVARIDWEMGVVRRIYYGSKTTSKHINYVGSEFNLTVVNEY